MWVARCFSPTRSSTVATFSVLLSGTSAPRKDTSGAHGRYYRRAQLLNGVTAEGAPAALRSCALQSLPPLSLPLECVHDLVTDAPLPHHIERNYHGDDDAERDLHFVAPHMAEQPERRLAETPAREREEVRPRGGTDAAADEVQPERHPRRPARQ